MTWLTLREATMHSGVWVWWVIALLCAIFSLTPIGVFYSVLLAIGLSVFLAIAASRPFALLRQSGYLELLTTCPLSAEEIVSGHCAALRQIFLKPLVILGITGAAWVARTYFGGNDSILGSIGDTWRSVAHIFCSFVTVVCCLPWVGMWMGLVCKTPARAGIATLGWVLVVPLFWGFFAGAPIIYALLWLIARREVYRSFRALRLDAPPANASIIKRWFGSFGRRGRPQPAT